MVMTNESEDRSEIAFFDVETTIPTRPGQGYAILEFGAIWVCPRKLVELRHYTSLVRPKDLSQISSRSVQCNGITKEEVASAPSFSEIADTVYNILHGRIWAGHNILRFDCVRIREAFAEINRPPPEPKGTIDSLTLLTQKFGRRAGDMKMATLATYFGLGEQTHRSLDDVRMNLEVVKCCATVLFLESSLPDIFTDNSWISPYSAPRNRSDIKKSTEQNQQSESTPRPIISIENVSTSFSPDLTMSEDHLIRCFMTPNSGKTKLHQNIEPTSERPGPFNMETLRSEIENEPLPEDDTEDENIVSSPEESSSSVHYESSNGFNDFSEPDKISIPSISATLAYPYPGIHRIQILHNNRPLQLKCSLLKIRFGISTKYVDYAGRPRLSILVNASRDLCSILDVVNELAQKQSVDSGSFSEWRPVVNRKPGYYNFPTIRLHLPTSSDGEETRLITEIYRKDDRSNTERRMCSRYDIAELESLLASGSFVDASFSFASYDYQQNAGVKLVAEKLIVHS